VVIFGELCRELFKSSVSLDNSGDFSGDRSLGGRSGVQIFKLAGDLVDEDRGETWLTGWSTEVREVRETNGETCRGSVSCGRNWSFTGVGTLEAVPSE